MEGRRWEINKRADVRSQNSASGSWTIAESSDVKAAEGCRMSSTFHSADARRATWLEPFTISSLHVMPEVTNALTLQRSNVSHCGPVMSNQFMQAPGNLAQGTMLNSLNELGEDVACLFNHFRQFVEGALGIGAMAAFEFCQAIDLELLFLARCADHFHGPEFITGIAIPIQADDGPGAVVDLLFVAMGGGLDLAALVTMFDGRQHSAQPVNFPELVQDAFLHGPFDDFHSGRSGQRVHQEFEQARFLEEDGLRLRRETDIFLARCRERFVRAVAVTGVSPVDVGEHQFDRGAGEVVFEFLRDERTAAGLRVQFEQLRPRVSAECLAHPDRPKFAANSRQRHILDVQPAIEEERQARSKQVYFQA